MQINGAASYTATYNGEYTFTLTTPGSTATAVTVTAPAKVTISVNGGKAIALERNTEKEDEEEYMCTGLTLQKGDTVVITNEGAAYAAYKSGCGFDGTAPRTGNYDFYVQLTGGDNDIGIWVTVPARVVNITVNGSTTHNLLLDVSGNEFFIYNLFLNAGDTVVIKDDGVQYNTYKACGFSGTATKTGYHDFYVNIDGSDKGIWVNYSATAKAIVYFNKNANNDSKYWDDVYAHCWKNGNDANNNGGWPGAKMKNLGDGWYVINVDKDAGFDRIIFDQGEGGYGNQTGDLNFNATTDVLYYDMNGITVAPTA